MNGGNKVPSDIKKVSGGASSVFTAVGDFRNGKLNVTFQGASVTPADASSVLTCPTGQTATLIAFTFSAITVTPKDGQTGRLGDGILTEPSTLSWPS